ncbi:imidazolonepropionase [Clostridium tagluense]|nr:imidazolonepropionase [Clostridium tagluense]MBZ9623910.1 imidazolonepropionase [Clostridium sp. FP2]MBW9157834.1 imidazolonepropionase [Clostridium tagluense]MCB2311669.1 imidazolonepropionase [Clostridium tagluense]MCB2316393.1 imidazolonepropionase [Clostridium tagluense]
MLDIIIKNIGCLVTCEGSYRKKREEFKDAKIKKNGYLVIENDKIKAVGEGEGYKEYLTSECTVIDGEGKTVTPGLIDPHTHVVYAGSRENELPLKLNKVGYIEILNSGGGILSTVENTRNIKIDQLVEESRKRLDIMLKHGTTTVESKSGYGLDLQTEVKILEVNKILNETHPIDVVSTFMAAHALPKEYKSDREAYIGEIINNMIPYVSENKLAEFIDCFCEKGVFSVEECRRILTAGKKFGLNIKIHADEVETVKAAELAGELKATSAEHLVAASDEGIKALAENDVVAVLLPSTSFYLMLNHFARARKMIEEGVAVSLATDCNPGTSPTESLQTVMTFACFGMKLFPEEIINAMTINAACAINRESEIGSIEVGKKADIAIFNSKNLNYLIYHFGANAIDTVIKNGKIVVKN